MVLKKGLRSSFYSVAFLCISCTLEGGEAKSRRKKGDQLVQSGER